MKLVVWLVLLFAAAVVAALTLGANDGLASFYWAGWRIDLSLNLFLLLLIAGCFALVTAIQAIESLTTLPRRARQWRLAQRERMAQVALREALTEYFGARYSRAQKAAQRALNIHAAAEGLQQDPAFESLAYLLAASSAHRLQDRRVRDEAWQRALISSGRGVTDDVARLLAAEWAVDDRDANRALTLLAELSPGAARRTQALRLRLQAARLAGRPLDALHTARLLAKHQAFSKVAAQGLLRSLAFEALEAARDVDQLRAAWASLEAVDRRNAFVAARAAQCAAELGAFDDSRGWLKPFFDDLISLPRDARETLSLALIPALVGVGPDWVQRLEAAAQRLPRDGHLACALGQALFERQLWGKSRQTLESVVDDAELPAAARRRAWLALAAIAEQEGDDTRRAHCVDAAARLR